MNTRHYRRSLFAVSMLLLGAFMVVVPSSCLRATNDYDALMSAETKYKEAKTKPEKLQAIDNYIKALQERKKVCKWRAYYYRDQAQQVLTFDWLQYRKYVAQEEAYEDEIKSIDSQIAELEKEKQALQ